MARFYGHTAPSDTFILFCLPLQIVTLMLCMASKLMHYVTSELNVGGNEVRVGYDYCVQESCQIAWYRTMFWYSLSFTAELLSLVAIYLFKFSHLITETVCMLKVILFLN